MKKLIGLALIGLLTISSCFAKITYYNKQQIDEKKETTKKAFGESATAGFLADSLDEVCKELKTYDFMLNKIFVDTNDYEVYGCIVFYFPKNKFWIIYESKGYFYTVYELDE